MSNKNITPEEKRLIFEDINAKLAFGTVKVIDTNDNEFDVEAIYWNKKTNKNFMNFQILINGKWVQYDFKKYKLCLRSLLDMTEIEKKELISNVFLNTTEAKYFNFDLEYNGIVIINNKNMNFVGSDVVLKLINYLDSHNFDVRDLIKQELAIKI